jgi:ADP-heptose:LPS heptosyltransferase
MKILVVQFRQMGDAILATPLLSTLRANCPFMNNLKSL